MASSAPVTGTSHSNKPKLSTAQLFNMSFGFFGIQFGFALQNANVSPYFKRLVQNWIRSLFYGSQHHLQASLFNL